MKDELVVYNKPKSNISEDIRTIRTNLMFTSSQEDAKVLLVTSSVPGEGKSFISSNLAAAFAQTGKSTLLIEKNTIEFAEYIKKCSIDNLYVIPRGTVPPNPSELLNSNNTKRVIEFLRDKFDHIIFDGVPINGLPDSLIMASLVDRVIVVSSANYTKIDELNDTKKALEKIDAKIAGVVFNRANQTKRGKYSNYYE